MSLTDILGTALSGLSAAQAGLRTVSGNVANVGTAGYAREVVNQATQVTQGTVSGVTSGQATRIADAYLEGQVYTRSGDAGAAQVANDTAAALVNYLGKPGQSGGLTDRASTLGSAAIALDATTANPAAVQSFVAAAGDMLTGLGQARSDALSLRAEVAGAVGDTVTQINALLGQIHDLNTAIASAQGTGKGSAGAQDQRASALGQLSGLIDVTARPQPDGRIFIDSGDGKPLLDTQLYQLSGPPAASGALDAVYPPITIRRVDTNGTSVTIGATLSGAAAGGTLGGQIAARDGAIPAFIGTLDTVLHATANALNTVTNNQSAVPAPATLTGRPTGLSATDRLGFTGAIDIAAVDGTGVVQARSTIDLSSLPTNATVGDAVNAINGALGGKVTASLDASGTLTLAAAPGLGVGIAQGTPPSDRAGAGFAHYFGLNDLIRTPGDPLVASGLTATDPTGIGAGQSAILNLRAADGTVLASQTLDSSSGASFGDLVNGINAGPLARYGTVALDTSGHLAFAAKPGLAGATMDIGSDTTSRSGTGVGIGALLGLTTRGDALANARVRTDIIANPALLPLATLQPGAAGTQALAPGDQSGAGALVTALTNGIGGGSLDSLVGATVAGAASNAAQASSRSTSLNQLRDDAISARDAVSGVNLDEELSHMVTLQNSYAASARLITTASTMMTTLLNMVGSA